MQTVHEALSKPNRASLRFMVRLNAFGVGLAALWTTVNTIILPERVGDVVSVGMRGTSLGIISLIGIGAAALIQPVAGFLSDRSQLFDRRRPFMVVGAAGVALASIGFGLAGHVVVLLVAYLAMQLASNVAQAAFQALIPDLVAAPRRGLASGVKNALNVVGIGIGLVGSQIVFSATDSHSLSLLFLALVLLASAALAWWWTPLVPPERRSETGRLWSISDMLSGLLTSSIRAFRQNPLFARAVLAQFLFLLGTYPLQCFLLYFLEERFDLTDAALSAGGYLAAGIVLGVIAAPVSGVLSDQIGRVPVLRWSIFLGAIGLIGVAIAPTLPLAAAAGAVVAVGSGSFLSVNWALLSEGIPDGKGAQYYALSNISTAGASALAGLFGPLADAIAVIVPGGSYPITFAIGAGVSLIALWPLRSPSR